MTQQEIQALINAKIAGQGNQIDLGGALPSILAALNELAGNAVSPDKTDMTEQEQMKVRKNLGLYYEETTTGEKSASYTDQSESPTLSGYAKISDDTPAKDDIISFSASTGDDLVFEDRTDGFVITPVGAPSGVQIIVVLDNSAGNEPGIYYNLLGAEYADVAVLVYNGLITTVSKIPEKFLPEQESGSSLPWLDLEGTYDLPNEGVNVDLSAYITQENWAKLLNGEYVGIHTSENLPSFVPERYRVMLNSFKGLSLMPGSPQYCVFAEAYENEQSLLFIVGASINNVTVKKVRIVSAVPGPVILSSLPTAQMTTQAELDEIGLTAENIQKIVLGNATALCLGLNSRLILGFVSYLSATNYEIQFSDNNNKYLVLNVGFISVTVTPLS